ncbi:molybdopterin converting factor small subunit [Actinomycetospora succinea]|uniref:Molybdopterin synthase sulfur carrier subunit n=1 Tax=Actinomycetospora succinea TaxID=663603 RepID=A0A4R6VHY1_9PSEU|nr:molybdopterin converting factor small subunit [Actinomycetospora succinea]
MMGTTTDVRVSTVTVTVRYFAGAKAAAGTRSEPVEIPAGATVADLVTALAADHGEALARVLGAASFLLDETAVHDRTTVLPHGATFDVLPPFAGG